MRDDAVLRRALPLGRGLGRAQNKDTKIYWIKYVLHNTTGPNGNYFLLENQLGK